jgi:hypothetical protein
MVSLLQHRFKALKTPVSPYITATARVRKIAGEYGMNRPRDIRVASEPEGSGKG